LHQTYLQYSVVADDDADAFFVHLQKRVSTIAEVLRPVAGDDQERGGQARDGREEGGQHGERGLADHEVTQQT